MTLRQLQIFIAVADCGRMKEAAQRLFISQPTVSEAIAELERQYDIPLFERYPKQLVLTIAGRRLYGQAREILDNCAKVEDMMRSMKYTPQLHIGGTVTAGYTVLVPALTICKEKEATWQPCVYIRNTKTIEEKLVENQYDVGITQGTITHKELHQEMILEDSLVFACSIHHPLAKKKSVSLEDIAGQPFILQERGGGGRGVLEHFMESKGLPLQVAWSCTNFDLIRNAVANNLGISLLSKRLIACSGREDIHILDGYGFERNFYLVSHKHKKTTPMLETFISACYEIGKKGGTL